MKNLIFSLFITLVPLLSLYAQGNLPEQLKETMALSQEWIQLQDRGTIERDLYEGQSERSELIISGIPRFIKQVDHKGKIFRHYIGSNMPIILQSSQLKTGITPYVIIQPGFSRIVYEDLVGIFLTTPETPPHEVGLPRNDNADYIDLELYPETPVFEIEPAILLIPGHRDYPAWVKKIYEDYKKTGQMAAMYKDMILKIEARGGLIPPTFMSIKIVKYRMNGLEVNLK